MYLIDLEAHNLEIVTYQKQHIEQDLAYFGKKNALELSDFDWKVFETQGKATLWMESYKLALKDLKRLKDRVKDGSPPMLLKRRYLAQTAMREKLFTVRSYAKPWQKGQAFYFHDQTYYINVKLKKITKLEDSRYRYDFELA